MMLIITEANRAAERVALRAMFEARKQVFVDLLRWQLPVLAGRYEVDQFDDGHAVYLVLRDPDRRHLASARLLPSLRPGILNTLYADLADEPLPTGPGTFEITRFCLSRDLRATERRIARDRLVCGLAAYALQHGIATYTGVADLAWMTQILQFGWRCRSLGLPKLHDGRLLGALRIDITPDALDRLAAAGLHDGAERALAA